MTVQLASLRVTADMDSSSYARGMAQKVAADKAGADSAKAVGAALAALDAATEKSVAGVAKLTSRLVEGYAPATQFEKTIRGIGSAVDRGMGLERANLLLDATYRKFGLTANGATLAKQGFVSIAPAVDALNKKLEIQEEIANRAAAALARHNQAVGTQKEYRERFGIADAPSKAESDRVMVERGSAFSAMIDAAEIKERSDIQAEIARRAAVVKAQHENTVSAQRQYRERFGIVDAPSKGESEANAAERGSAFIAAYEAEQKELDQLAAKARAVGNPIAEAKRKNAEEYASYEKALKAGKISQQEFDDASNALTGRLAFQIKTINQTEVAISKYTRGTGLARHELVNLGRQAQDVFVSLGSGQSPLTVLLQQGTQIGDIFASSEATMRQFFAQAVSGAGRFVFSIGGAITAVGALGVAAATAGYQYADSQKELESALTGIGRGAGVTVGQLNQIADAAARAGSVSRGAAREAAGIFAGTGRIDQSLLPGLVGAAKPFGTQTGKDSAEAARELAAAFADPVRGAEQLDARLGFLSGALREYIKNASDAGDRTAAQKALFDAFAPSVDMAEKRLNAVAKGWGVVAKAFKDYWDIAGEKVVGAFTGSTVDERLAEEQKRLREMRQPPRGMFDPVQRGRGMFDPVLAGSSPQQVAAQQSLIASLQDDVNRRNGGIRRQQRDVESNLLSTRATDVVKSVVSDIGQLQKLSGDRDLLRKALGDPETLAKLGVTADQAREALGRLEYGVANFKTAAERSREDSALQVAQIAAYTLAERSAIEATRAWVTAMRDTSNAAYAAAEADKARNAVLAEAARQAREGLRDARDAASLIGLKPYERALRDLENRTQRQRETTTLPVSASPLPVPSAGVGGANDNTFSGAFAAVAQQFLGGRATLGDLTGYLRTAGGHVDTAGLDQTFSAKLRALVAGIDGITITSGFRSAEYNARVGGVQGSNHTHGTAADMIGPAASLEMIRQRAAELGLRVIPSNRGAVHVDMAGDREAVAARFGVNAGQPARDVEEARRLNRGIIADQFIDAPIREANAALTAQIELTRRQAETWMLSTGEQVKAAEAQRLLNEYIRAGVPITDQLREKILAYGERAGRAAEETKRLQETQRGIASLAEFGGNTLIDAFDRIAFGGENVSRVVNDITRSLVKMMLQGALLGQGPIAQLFGLTGNGGAPGGIIGALLGGFGGGGNNAATTSKDWGFDKGGFTGFGGRLEPAGVVHRGEYVFDAASTSRIGVANLDRMRRMRGYAHGGYVQPALPDRAAANSNQPGAGSGNVVNNVYNYASDKATVETRPNSQGGTDTIIKMRDQLKSELKAEMLAEAADGGGIYRAIGSRRGW